MSSARVTEKKAGKKKSRERNLMLRGRKAELYREKKDWRCFWTAMLPISRRDWASEGDKGDYSASPTSFDLQWGSLKDAKDQKSGRTLAERAGLRDGISEWERGVESEREASF